MSEEFPDLRTHLLPGLLQTAVRNLARGSKSAAIFEIGSVFRNLTPLKAVVSVATDKKPNQKIIEEIYSSVPVQPLHVGAVVAGNFGQAGWLGDASEFTWNDAIGMARKIISNTGNISSTVTSDFAPWHPGRCAELQVDGKPVAHAGELHPRVIAALGLPERSCAFVVVLSALPFQNPTRVTPVWTMPAAVQDIAIVVSQDIPAESVAAALRTGAGELLESISLFDRYEAIGDGKVSLAFTLVFRAPDRTLTAEEVSTYRLAAAQEAKVQFGATLRD